VVMPRAEMERWRVSGAIDKWHLLI
jgi:hypothetical protein